ncbi:MULTISPECIES: RnfABCDGE type electron transport complex subunit D [Mesotoga]|uniref:Ion-translocating oxidoreductase complex subunit D n=2 Tax=Mesotoga TaxID=1184396 RepID=I2F529_9BACT|nr:MULTISPECIES: RnfABCDGE type electron transport complex subunit D [Mesotoga]MCP5457471.1 RnfABCDGE type electron transport complex subunit D [Thermotogota bacterium]CCU83675.1 Electron transport complex, RnfABCDGE type, D subunit [Mesotoga infera]AFK07032.1 electron transport complex, RnfABCDGE type, D subunit [Mesotoga prima MesG1.Ag.4.2]MCP5460836.1 RnfABCDGE type electron transport complex subunit D [Thermotogota bacterium]HNQ70702.1 RnfABCDGE type electron transport complex subunit D [M
MKLSMMAAPHLRSEDSVRKIMLDVLIALAPAAVWAVVSFGLKALVLIVVCTAGAEVLDFFVMRFIRRKKNFKPDLSGSVTGLLLALNLSVAVEWWQALIGVFVAIVIAKAVFGGLGKNFFNPALVGRVFLLISFPVQMTTWLSPFDMQTTATPMAILKQGGPRVFSLQEMFLGTIPGSLGEVSALLLLLGFGWLLFRKRVSPFIPVAYIGTVVIMAAIFNGVNPGFGSPLYHVFGGGLMLGALFMATDMVTSPMSIKGHVIFGVGCGAVTMIIRLFGGYPEGVSFAILVMNAFVPLIDMGTKPRIFGKPKKVKSNA